MCIHVTCLCAATCMVTSIIIIYYQAQQKQFRVDPTEIGSSAKGVSTLGGSGGMLLQGILKFSFFRMHIWLILREN